MKSEITLPLQHPEPRKGQPPVSIFVCPSSLGRSIVAFQCHPLLPVLPLFSPLDLLCQCRGWGSAVAGPSPVQMPTLWDLLCRSVYDSKVPKSPPGSFRTFSYVSGVSCWAAGCPPGGYSSPIVSLCYLGSPWRRHLAAKAVEMLLGSCTWAAAMVPLCSSLGGER